MKNKKIARRIKSSLKLIKEFNKKGKSGLSDQLDKIFGGHVKKHEHAVHLRDEIDQLKSSIKSKKKEISSLSKDLSKSKKSAQKALKKAKNLKSTEPVSIKKSIPVKVSRVRNRKPAPALKATKPKITLTDKPIQPN